MKKVAGSTTTVYIFSGSKVIAEYANGAAPSSPTREYIYAGGALLARIDSSGTNYYHQDHLSNRMVTNSSGGVAAEMGHFPFGESWYNATNDKLYFTTYEYDSESGNHYAMARYHVSRLGRLSAPDPIAGSTANPQSLNRYSYSINDPANVTDPSGALPLSNCTTAQANPKNQSQQLTGGHSDRGNSDTDTDTGDGDADPPPQSGCILRVNPYGGGGANIDGGFGGDDSGDLPSGGFGPGQSTPGGTDLASEIALESVQAWFGWLPGNAENGDAPWMWYRGTIFWTFNNDGPGGSQQSGQMKPKHYRRTIPCALNASQVMSAVESNFARFGNYSRWLGSESVTFSPPAGMGVGSRIPISVEILGATENLSVNVQSMNSQSMTFTTNPGHLLYPAHVTFSDSPASSGSINFNIDLGGTIAQPVRFYMGGSSFEDAQWKHFLDEISALCKGGR